MADFELIKILAVFLDARESIMNTKKQTRIRRQTMEKFQSTRENNLPREFAKKSQSTEFSNRAREKQISTETIEIPVQIAKEQRRRSSTMLVKRNGSVNELARNWRS